LIKKQQKLPLYKQICELLHREITAGHWLPGDRLPIESELANNLGVAIGTLRKSLAQLEAQGFLERRQGSGTYVKRAPTGEAVYQFFHLELPQGGGVPSAVILAIDLVSDKYVAKKLALKDLERSLWRIKRERYLNGNKVAVEEIWIDSRHCQQLLIDDIHESLYVHYRENFNFWIARVEDSIFCEQAPKWVQQALTDAPSTEQTANEHHRYFSVVERKGWSNKETLEEFSRTWFVGEKCRYIARWS